MSPRPRARATRVVAFVLGGGGHLGAHEVGMLRALLEAGVRPGLVVGTSVGAMNGAAVAADPTLDSIRRLASVWENLDAERLFGASPFTQAATLIRTRTSLHSNRPLRRLIERLVPVALIEELPVPFQCVAACVDRAAEHWFTEGPLADAILASSAVPGILPPVEIGGEHFIDGGIVNSIPIGRAVELGASVIYVMHVGRIERPLTPPRNLWQTAMVAFEIARRHRFARDMAALPEGVVAHVLPSGERNPPRYDSAAQLRYRDFSPDAVRRRIAQAHRASAAYLKSVQDLVP